MGGLRINNQPLRTFSDLSGLAKIHAPSAIILTIFMFSLAGIPPLAGFFIKFSVLQSAANAGLIYPVIIAVLASAVSAFYYLKIIKTAYFDEAADNIDISIDKTHYYIAVAIAILIVLYVFYPAITSDILASYIAQYGTVV